MRMPKAFHVQAVEPLPTEAPPQPPKPPVDWTKITVLTQDTIKQMAKLGVAAYGTKKVIDAATEIAVIAAKAKFK